ncbi:hypothetical protein ACPCHT_01320 [Nucisporomicrobium flavum]|uniref:hypothetical protein n=1 Tax=Nucisporomicrobium flavum TaxID=2785915 RepID=UPI003C2E1091
MRGRRGLIVGVVVLLAGVAAIAGWRWWHAQAPYPPEALGTRTTLELVDPATAAAALRPVNVEVSGKGDQILLGTVSWTLPPSAPTDGSFRLVLLDRRTKALPGFVSVTSPRPESVGSGSDGTLDAAADRYDWLTGAGKVQADGSTWRTGDYLTVATDASPVTFAAVLHPADPRARPQEAVMSAPVTLDDVLLVLIGVGPDGQVYWAQRLSP